VPVLVLGCLPWSLLLVPLAQFLFSRSESAGRRRPPGLGFYLLWAGWCVLFFSLSRSKLPPYVLPAVPALALLLGHYLEAVLFGLLPAAFSRRAQGHLPLRTIQVVAVAWLATNAWAWATGLADPRQSWVELAEAAVAVGCLVGVAFWGARLPARAAWTLCGLLGLGLVRDLATDHIPAWSYQRSPLAHADQLADLLADRRTGLVCVGAEWGSVPFYLRHDDQLFNCQHRTLIELQRFMARHPRVLFLARGEGDVALVRWVMPDGTQLNRILTSGQAALFQMQFPGSKGGE
jgi:dolichol-phosphate mannosyltransferase